MSSSINLGLERIRDLLPHLPHYTRPTIHVAGTNGKGSVTVLLSSILKASSYRVGRFNSPHLVSVLDSITIDDSPVAPDKYAEIRGRVEQANTEHGVGATSFELLTATALCVFEDAQVDFAVIEVGMGGRLDATNAIPDECILVSALTVVDLDHQAYLGNTVEEIATEKAAIARRGRPFVLAPQVHPRVNNVVRDVVWNAGGITIGVSPPWKRKWDLDIDGERPQVNSLLASEFVDIPQPVACDLRPFPKPVCMLLPLRGDHQLLNLGTALTIVGALLRHIDRSQFPHLRMEKFIRPETVIKGVRTARWPGRLSFHTVPLPFLPRHGRPEREEEVPPRSKYIILADGAHNSASSATLSAFISDLLTQTTQTTPDTPRTVTLSFALALSQSPPKTPLHTLSPLFAPINTILSSSHLLPNVTLRVRVALLRFTPPEGMPWVKSEAPSTIRSIVSALIPSADIWASADDATDAAEELNNALAWAAQQQQTAAGEVGEGLIVVAGSLYLVADFYRLLRSQRAIDLET